MRFVTLVALATGAFCSLDARGAAADDRPAATGRPLVLLTGADSQVRKPAYYRISSNVEWKKVWCLHHGKTEREAFEPPLTAEIDFEKCMAASGQSTDRAR